MAKPRAWTFTTEDGDVMLSDTGEGSPPVPVHARPCLPKYPLPDLVRDFENDAPIRATTLLLTAICRALAQQVDPGLPGVLAAGVITEYCATFPDSFLVGVPASEEGGLLGWPDLAHELAHIRYAFDRDTLVGDFTERVAEPFYAERAGTSSSPLEAQQCADASDLWRGDWLEELACDILATYELGEAYAWQHMRLAMGREEDAHDPRLADAARTSHPADAARMHAIAATLGCVGLGNEATEVMAVWTEYLAAHDYRAERSHETAYPPGLIDELARQIVRVAPGLRVRGWDTPLVSGTDLRALMREAWAILRRDPEGFPAWQRRALSALKVDPVVEPRAP